MFEIFILPDLYSKISYLFRKSDLEVGALLECYNEGEKFIVEDMFIIKQEVSSSSVDFDEDAVNMLLLECMDSKKVISGWLHSHNTMDAFWSGVDDSTISSLNNYIGKWVLSIVGNKKMELVGRIDYISNTPFGDRSIRVDDVPIHTLPEISQNDMNLIDDTISENVTKKAMVGYRYVGKVNNTLSSQSKKAQSAQTKQLLLHAGEPDYENMTDQEIANHFGCNLEEYDAALELKDEIGDQCINSVPIGEMTDEQWLEYCKLLEAEHDKQTF